MRAELWPANALIAVFGATGTGKSKLALTLAQRFGGEVINADAIQLYEGLPIVTNKISPEEISGVKHHLLGSIGLNMPPWTVSQYIRRASSVIEEIRQKGKLPILVGGTHYYTQALLFEDQTVMNHGGEYIEKDEKGERWPILKGTDSQILEKLREVDPDMAARWHPKDSRRIRRSLEIWLQTGRRASEIYAEQKQQSREEQTTSTATKNNEEARSILKYDTLAFWTYVNNEKLKPRLDERVDTMMQTGLLEEVRHMRHIYNSLISQEKAVDVSSGIWVAIGYKEFLDYLLLLESGVATEAALSACIEQAVEKTKTATRQYAKKQERWIRLKLIPSLQQTTLGPRVFPLNASNVDDWESQVEIPAVQIAKSFLEQREVSTDILPEPALLNLLSESRPAVDERLPQAITCESCGVVMTTVSGQEMHMGSRRHRRMAKKAKLGKANDQVNCSIIVPE